MAAPISLLAQTAPEAVGDATAVAACLGTPSQPRARAIRGRLALSAALDFHRVVPGFVIQAGDPTGTGRGGPGYSFRDELEADRRYLRGTLAMANAGPNTNGSQFFICLGDLKLPHQYTIFGEVTEGMEAVDAIATLPTDSQDRPRQEAVISKVTVIAG